MSTGLAFKPCCLGWKYPLDKAQFSGGNNYSISAPSVASRHAAAGPHEVVPASTIAAISNAQKFAARPRETK
jgi:hypothetical protein